MVFRINDKMCFSSTCLLHPTEWKFVATMWMMFFTRVCNAYPRSFCGNNRCWDNFRRQCAWEKQVLPDQSNNTAAFCFVVRTYWKQVYHPFYNVSSFFHSLLNLQESNWYALVVNTDTVPLRGLRKIIQNIGLQGKVEFLRQGLSRYKAGDAGYAATDTAIKRCPENAQWLVVTNADNYYHPRFLSGVSNDYDIVATDFFSRHVAWWLSEWKINPYQCARFSSLPCMRNTLSLGHTDLGSNIWNLRTWRCQGIYFSDMFYKDGTQDGQLAETLMLAGWKVKFIHDSLFYHNPSPVSCKLLGGIWMSKSERCATVEEANTVQLIAGGVDIIPISNVPLGRGAETFRCIEA